MKTQWITGIVCETAAFIVVSAVGQERITEDAFNLGAYYYILKPFDNEFLLDRIKDIGNLSSGKRTLHRPVQGQAVLPKPVDNPHLIKQQFRQKHRPNDRHNIGKQKHRLQQHMFLCLLFQQKRDQVRHQQDQRKPCQQKTERIPAGKAEHLILHHLQIIGKPDKNTAPPRSML